MKSRMETFWHRLTRVSLEMIVKQVSPRCQFGHKCWSTILAPRASPCRVVGFAGACKRYSSTSLIDLHNLSYYMGIFWIPNSFWNSFGWDVQTDGQTEVSHVIVTCLTCDSNCNVVKSYRFCNRVFIAFVFNCLYSVLLLDSCECQVDD